MPTADFSFLAHQGTQAGPVLLGLAQDQRAADPDVRLGTTVLLPRYKPGTAEDRCLDLDAPCSYVLGDPETHRLHFPFDERGIARHDYAYLAEADPLANRDRFVENTLRAQANASRSVLISPWLIHGIDPTDDHLLANIDFARRSVAHPLAKDREVLAGFAVTDAVLENNTARNRLLDELVELDLPLYLRVRVVSPESFRQYSNASVLEGLRLTVESLQANGISVLLPQTGLAGWLMMPFGARSFGSGINGSLQKFPYPTGGFGQPLEWWFCPSTLGFILRDEVGHLSGASGWLACPCPYCPALDFTGTNPWDRNAAGMHYLYWCSLLANEVRTATSPVDAVRDRLTDAQAFWTAANASGVLLDPRSEPGHLGDWSAAIA